MVMGTLARFQAGRSPLLSMYGKLRRGGPLVGVCEGSASFMVGAGLSGAYQGHRALCPEPMINITWAGPPHAHRRQRP